MSICETFRIHVKDLLLVTLKYRVLKMPKLTVGVTTGANDPFGAAVTSSKTSPTVVAIP